MRCVYFSVILVQIVEEGLQCFLCVAKIEMDTAFTCVERIVNTCVAGLCVIVEDADCLAVANVQDRHTIDRCAFCGVGCRVQNVVCTNNDCCICICKFGVDVVHFVEVFVVNVCFAEEHIDMAARRAREWAGG